MCYGICKLTVIPLRAEPSHKSEMVSQLLYGESYKVTDTQGEWLQIVTVHDNYSGWIQNIQHFGVTLESLEHHQNGFGYKVLRPIALNDVPEKQMVTMGAVLDKNADYTISEESMQNLSCQDKIEILEASARKLLDTPYLWGGRTPLGIDCSGFVQLLYSLVGVSLPRDASQQVSIGDTIDFVNQSKIGDLAFFQNEEGNIVHVGMILEPDKIIHASGKVRIDNIDETGIFNKELSKYTHFLRIVKRIL